MSKILFFLISILLNLLFIKPVFALQTFGDITVDHDPKPITVDDKSMTFTLTAPSDNYFSSSLKYTGYIWKDGQKIESGCLDATYGKMYITGQVNSTGSEVIFTAGEYRSSGVACGQIGKYHFRAWVGDTGISNTPNPFIPDYSFSREQKGGGEIRIEAVKNPLGLSEDPKVNLYNARKDSFYEFWWDGSKTEFAKKESATADTNIMDIALTKNGVDWKNPGGRKLCMEIGNDANPIGVTCRKFIEFGFKPLPVSTAPPKSGDKCIVTLAAAHVPDPSKDDSISAYVNGLPPNEEFHVDLTPSDPPTRVHTDTADAKGASKIFPVGTKLAEGKYSLNVYNADSKSNQLICSLEFNVGDGTPIAKKACKGDKCSQGGADLCETEPDRGPAIKTAVGCIHTNPPEFAKDLLKFLIGIGGGLAFLMMLLGAFQMMTSAGNPDTLKAGRERLTSAVIGLLFIIFSILFLKIIGVDILNIPGFKESI